MFSDVQAVFNRRLRFLAGLLAALYLCLFMPLTVWATAQTDTASAASASLETGYDEFLVTAETLYDAVNKGDVDVTLKSLRVLEYRFRILSMYEIKSVEGIAALAESISEMRRAVTAVTPNEERWKSDAAALRLAADALARPDKPLWHRYRSILGDDIAALSKSLEEEAAAVPYIIPTSAIVALERLSQHYRVIRTAVLLKTEPSIVERSDSVLRYAQRMLKAEKPNAKMLKGIVPAIQSAMGALFPGEKETTAFVPPAAAPPWGWSAMMGSFIVTVLTWVGWRRYRAEPYATSRRRSRLRDEQDPAERLLKRWRK